MSFCSPLRSNNDFSCFSFMELLTMAKAWNTTLQGKSNPINLLKYDKFRENPEIKKEIWLELSKRFFPFCGKNEACWIDNVELEKSLKKLSPEVYRAVNFFTLKPKGTEKKNGWLSTTEIDYVMQQYEQVFPDFKFIGCLPSDYYKLNFKMFPIYTLEHYKKSAIIFNQDSSNQKGSHWVAIFFENKLDGLHVEYFDPVGEKPVKNTQEFLNNPFFKKENIVYSNMKHQKGNNECGNYSLYFVLERLSGTSIEKINSKRISDSSMNKFRSCLFRPFSDKFSLLEKI